MTKHSYSLAEFGERHGISNTTIWRLIKRGDLRAVKIGRRTVITADDESAWLSSLKVVGGKAA